MPSHADPLVWPTKFSFMLHSVCTVIWQNHWSAHMPWHHVCIKPCRQPSHTHHTLASAKGIIVTCIDGFVYHHFALHGFVYHCIHDFVYHHSLCIVLCTTVYMVLHTTTPHTWYCIHGIVYHRSLYMVSYTIVGYKMVSSSPSCESWTMQSCMRRTIILRSTSSWHVKVYWLKHEQIKSWSYKPAVFTSRRVTWLDVQAWTLSVDYLLLLYNTFEW